MSVLRQRLALRRQAQDVIDACHDRCPVDAADAAASAGKVSRLALAANDKLLEAEAALLAVRWLAPVPQPVEALAALQHAVAVFHANLLHDKALAAQAASALVLEQLGEERNAVATAQAVLAQPCLRPDVEALALYAMAMAHGRLGDLDAALAVLASIGTVLLSAASKRLPLLPARVAWAHARMHWQVHVYHHHRPLWRGLPDATGLLAVQTPVQTVEAIGQAFARADALLPPGQHWPYGELVCLTLRGLSAPAVHGAGSRAALADMAARLWEPDPSAGLWALIGRAKLLLAAGDVQQALVDIVRGRERAAALQLRSPLRDLLLYEMRARETLGDSAGALAAVKQLAIHRMRSLSVQPSALQLLASPGTRAPQPSPLRNLEPPHVRRALRFIDEQVRSPLSVPAVVEHSGVSRRTLEMAFKECKGSTLAQYIRQRKLELALEQLRLTRQTVQEVSRGLGFPSVAAFTREFAARFGMPPGAWLRAQGRERTA